MKSAKTLRKLSSFKKVADQTIWCLVNGKESKKECIKQSQGKGLKSFTEALVIVVSTMDFVLGAKISIWILQKVQENF